MFSHLLPIIFPQNSHLYPQIVDISMILQNQCLFLPLSGFFPQLIGEIELSSYINTINPD